MMKITPLLSFKGQAGEAIKHYQKAFGAEVIEKIHYGDADSLDLAYKVEERDYIYHAQLKIGEQILMMCDNPSHAFNQGTIGKMSMIQLSIDFETDEALKAVFDVLSDGGEVVDALVSQTYCSLAGSVIDKFGVHWGVMSGYKG